MKREGDGTCSLHINSTSSDDDGNYTIMAANPQVETQGSTLCCILRKEQLISLWINLEKCKLLRTAEENEWGALRLCVTGAQDHNLHD